MAKWLVVYEGDNGNSEYETVESGSNPGWYIYEGIFCIGHVFAVPVTRLISIKMLADQPAGVFLGGGSMDMSNMAQWKDEDGSAYIWPDRDGDAIPAPE